MKKKISLCFRQGSPLEVWASSLRNVQQVVEVVVRHQYCRVETLSRSKSEMGLMEQPTLILGGFSQHGGTARVRSWLRVSLPAFVTSIAVVTMA